jgi:hypothetical protein
LTRDEGRAGLAQLTGTYRLMAQRRSGSGLHLLECLRLRVKDGDSTRRARIGRATQATRTA